MMSRALLLLLASAVLAPIAAAADAPLPTGEELTWGREPVEAVSPVRGRICLNGLWRFMPALGGETPDAASSWGWIRVPGTWKQRWNLPGIVARGSGPAWQGFNGNELARAWYERTVHIPADWGGRAVLLELVRVSTDARVFANGIDCGVAEWPTGIVDITRAVRAGEDADIRVLVVATPEEGEVVQFMGVAENQVFSRPAGLDTRGIIGEVFLNSRPAGPHVSDVFVQTSTRNKQLTLDVELTGVKAAGQLSMVARCLDEEGREECHFNARLQVEPADVQVVQVKWSWLDPRIWDLGQPNLYNLQLEAKGPGLDDVYGQRFGFREFWIDGKHLYLNGTEFRMRPFHWGIEQWSSVGGIAEIMDRSIENSMWVGYNIWEMWPGNQDERGSVYFRELLAERCDEKGMPVTGVALQMNNYIYDSSWRFIWDRPGTKERYEKRMAAELRRWRNHPSIVMWGTSGNFFGHWQDQNPRVVGTRGWADYDAGWKQKADAGEEGIALVKKHDPTRPVFTHQGAYVGDIHTVNSYLDVIPLQEREEWLSHWAEHGEVPYWVVEFGTPLHCTYMRGRAGGGWGQGHGATFSEPLMTEFCAIYFGREAYGKETAAYRERIKERFIEGQDYKNWQNNPELDFAPANQLFQELFITNTWRSWRTFGNTGGMYPWSDGHGWERGPDFDEQIDLGPFRPGQRGVYFRRVPKGQYNYLRPEGNILHKAAKAIMANDGPTLAWIAGPEEAFTAKDRSFRTGQTIEKQIVLLNDTRKRQDFNFEWAALLEGREVGSGSGEGSMGVAEDQFFPIRIAMPESLDTAKADGEIWLMATIGGVSHTDRFAFRVFAPDSEERSFMQVFDPGGDTTRMLLTLGHRVRPWDGGDADVVVVGREAFSADGEPPADLEAYVERGGRLLVMSQDPEWLKTYLDLRVGAYLSRRVFPVAAGHPIMDGLDETDLRDWTGSSALVESRPDPAWDEVERGGYGGCPYYGWHWGNRGVVSSAPIEKPHRSGWRPLLECEFDLAYSPLMELDYGKGRITLCTLDLEDHVAADPAAEKLARNVVSHVSSAPLAAARRTYVLGDPTEGEGFADQMGLACRATTVIPQDAELVIVLPSSTVDQQVRTFVERGGRALFLAREQGPLGVSIKEAASFAGSLNVPEWPECRGLSPSDLRWRTTHAVRLVDGGCEVGADGLLGRMEIGKGVAVFCQIDPGLFDTETQTYFRYTRWRQTRALAQILANMGAAFRMDSRVFHPAHPDAAKIMLAGDWRAKITYRGRTADTIDRPIPDPGLSDEARRSVAADFDDGDWGTLPLPGLWEQHGGEWADLDGEAVFRKTIQVPEEMLGQDLTLSLGPVDDFDETFFNGVSVGKVGIETPGFYGVPRVYTIPAGLVKPGENVIAVRVFDHFGGGGLGGAKGDMFLTVEQDAEPESFYHPDYRDDFDYGDDPYRYCRW
jgi:beta-galactosidase